MFKQFIKHQPALLGLLLLSALHTNAYALSSDVEKPVHIEADSAEFNKAAGTAFYQGNVIITQGTLEILASRVDIIAPKNEIHEIKAVGGPIRFKQQMDDGKQAVGEAKNMVYYVKHKRLTLTGNAKLQQDRDTFASNHIEYMTKTGKLRAGVSVTGNKRPNAQARKQGRVRAVFHPTNKAQ